MNRTPLVTVGIPVYNGEQDLPESVGSILNQSYTNLEIIISDNASTDGTQLVAKQLAAQDHRIRYHRLDRNIGANANFEHVRRLARGEYFMWHGSDDVRPPGSIERLVQALERNPLAVMAHGPILAKVPGVMEEEIANEMDLSSTRVSRRIIQFTQHMRHIAMEYGLFRLDKLRQAVFEYPPHERPFGRFGDDYLICLQMCLLGPVEYVPHPMIVYRMRVIPPASPMGEDIPPTVNYLVQGTRRMWKSWSVLFFGCCYLLQLGGVDLRQRVTGAFAHISAFIMRYRRRLATDGLLIVCSTAAAWPLAALRHLRRLTLPASVDR